MWFCYNVEITKHIVSPGTHFVSFTWQMTEIAVVFFYNQKRNWENRIYRKSGKMLSTTALQTLEDTLFKRNSLGFIVLMWGRLQSLYRCTQTWCCLPPRPEEVEKPSLLTQSTPANLSSATPYIGKVWGLIHLTSKWWQKITTENNVNINNITVSVGSQELDFLEIGTALMHFLRKTFEAHAIQVLYLFNKSKLKTGIDLGRLGMLKCMTLAAICNHYYCWTSKHTGFHMCSKKQIKC